MVMETEDVFVSFQGAAIEKASHFDYEFFLGHKIVFVCVARGLPRPKITWFKDGVEIFGHPYMQVSASRWFKYWTLEELISPRDSPSF